MERIGVWICLALAAFVLPVAELSAQNQWPAERQAGSFLCHADFPLSPHRALLEELTLLEQDLSATLGAPRSREQVHLFLFQKQPTYQAYLKQYFPQVPTRRALFIKARGPGMVFAFQGSDFEIDVRHESTHALLHAWLPTVPLWLDEGLAEYFEVARAKRLKEHSHLPVVQALVRTGKLPRLAELEELEALEDMGRDEYRDAWAWVHFMLHGSREGRDELVRYLGELHSGSEPGRLSDRLRRRLPDLDRRVGEHFRS